MKTLAFDLPAQRAVRQVNATIMDEPVEAAFGLQGNRVNITLVDRITIEAEQTLRVQTTWG